MRVLLFLWIINLGIDLDAVGQSKAHCILIEARKLIGIKEAPGQNNRGPEVDKLILRAGGKPGQAWCGWTARAVHMDCGCPAGGGMAMSWFVPSRLVYKIVPGDVFSVWNKYLNRIGHIGIVEQVLPGEKFIVTIEGNTNGFGSREGSGVCRLTRPVKQVYNYARWWHK
jgi:hypothetical protein